MGHFLRSLSCGPAKATLLALLSLGVTCAALAEAAYLRGARIAPVDRFFDPRERPTVDDAGMAIAAAYASTSAELNDVVFIGDSACHDDVQPSRLSLPAFNLGTQQGTGPTGTLILLKLYLAHHPSPRLVVLCASPYCFEAPPGATGHPERFVENYAPEVDGLSSRFDVASYFVRRGALDLWKPAGDFRDSPLLGFERHTFRSLEAETSASRGFNSLAGDHGPDRPIDMPGPKERVHPDWDAGLRAMAETCRQARVPFLIRFAPIRESERHARDWSELERWADSVEGAIVAKPVVVCFPSQLMWDAIHLNAAGVERFMPIVASDVEAAISRRSN